MNAPSFVRGDGQGGGRGNVGGGLQRQHRHRRRAHSGGGKGQGNRSSALQGRLEEINLMVLHGDGSNSYQNMTLRALYNYVMKAITSRPAGAPPCPSSSTNVLHDHSPKSPLMRSRPVVAPHVLRQSDDTTTSSSSAFAVGSGGEGGGDVRRARSGSVSVLAPPCLPPPPPPPLFATDSPGVAIRTPSGGDSDRTPVAGGGIVGLEASAAGVGIASAAPTPPSGSGTLSSGQRVSFLSPIPGEVPPPLAPMGRRTATIGGCGGAEAGPGSSPGEGPESVHTNTTSAANIPQHVTYRERLGGYLHPRDMRRLVTPFSSSNAPELMVRRHVMLLNFDPLRAIVLRDRLLVIVPTGADSILMSLETRLRGGLDEVENEVFGEADLDVTEHGEEAAEEFAEIPLEAVAVDSPWDKGAEGGAKDSEKMDEFVIDEAAPAGNMDKQDTADSPAGSAADTSAGKTNKQSMYINEESATGDDLCKTDRTVENDGESSATSTEGSSEYDMEADEWEDIEGKNWIEMPFELQAVDAVLSSASLMLASEACDLEREVREAMATLRGEKLEQQSSSSLWRSWWRSGGRARPKPGEHAQERLRVQKDKVGEMEARVQGFVRAMNLTLDEDEDMALMNLSRLLTHPERFIQPVSQDILEEESDEPELILEGYLQQALSTVNALQLLKGQITSTEELVNMMLDTVRNRLLYINTFLSLVTLCVTVGSFIGSIFGMNLLNGLEEDGDAFQQVVIGTCVGGFVMLVAMSYAFNMAMSVTKY